MCCEHNQNWKKKQYLNKAVKQKQSNGGGDICKAMWIYLE